MVGLRGFFLCVVALGTIAMVDNAHGQDPKSVKTALDDVEEKAVAASSGDPSAIRRLVNEIFNRTIFANAPASLRERITRAETAFRRGSHPAIGEQELVESANQLAAEVNAPAHAKTNGAQVHLFRMFLKRSVRHFAESPNSSRDMSPAEVVFVALNLAAQKLSNDDYKVRPEDWVKGVAARQEREKAHPPKHETAKPPTLEVLRHPKKEVADLYWLLDRDLPVESGDAAQAMHGFLDRLGIAR